MTDVASEMKVPRQAGAADTPSPSGNGTSPETATAATPASAATPAAAATDEAATATDEAATDEAAAASDEGTAQETAAEPSAVTAEPQPGPASRGAGVVERLDDQVDEVVERANEVVERAAAASGRVASAVVERLRNNAEMAVERGTTAIADEVVEKITGIAVREVPGVYDIGGDVARVLAGLKERIGLGDADDDTDRGMRVRLEGRTAQINVTLVIEYGFVVHSVAEKVRTKVISAVENLLGLEVTEVNILVDDVHVPDGARSPE